MVDKRTVSILATYYLVLIAMLAASFFPEYRVWGFNHWAYYSSLVPVTLFIVGVLLPVVLMVWGRRFETGDDVAATGNDRTFLLWTGLLIIVYMVLFYLLRAKTHYLGDGYQLVGNLAAVNPWIKLRNLGEELVHKLVFNLLSGEESARSLKSFQIVSYVSGLALLLSVTFAAKRLFERNRDRLLFFLGLASSGYMLLYFGYVENYSVFVTMVMIYSLMGLLVANGKLNRWYLFVPLLLSIGMHAFGVILIPSAAYLFMAGTSAGEAVKRLDIKTRAVILAAVLIIAAAVFGYFYANVYFFRFAFVPLVENRFTIENYTLFSSKHLIDILNLCFLLLPSLALFVVPALLSPTRADASRRDMLFMIVLLISALAAVILFDPKLGMPRDWDLFSFIGIPMALMCFYGLLKARRGWGQYRQVAVMAIFLGLAVLLPRAVGRSSGDIEVAHVENYIQLDVQKNKNLMWALKEYFLLRGDTAKVRLLDEQWHRDFPERALNQQGVAKRDSGDFAGAVVYFRAAANRNPVHAPTYEVLAECYRRLGMYDSALTMLEIANGLNPNGTYILAEYARVYREQGKFNQAERYFRRAIEIDRSNLEAYMGLLEVYWTTGQTEKHSVLLVETSALPNAPPIIHKLLGDELLRRKMYREADFHYRKAISMGLDSVQIRDIIERMGQLKK